MEARPLNPNGEEFILPPPLSAPEEDRLAYVKEQASVYQDMRDSEYEDILASINPMALPEYIRPLEYLVQPAISDLIKPRVLPSGPAINLGEIGQEAGFAANAQVSINDAACRDLIGKTANTQMHFAEWYGASAGPPPTPVTYSGITRKAGLGSWDPGVSTSQGSGTVPGAVNDLYIAFGSTTGQRDSPSVPTHGQSVGDHHSNIRNDRGQSAGSVNYLIQGFAHSGTDGTWICYSYNSVYKGHSSSYNVCGFKTGVRSKLVKTTNQAGAIGWVCFTDPSPTTDWTKIANAPQGIFKLWLYKYAQDEMPANAGGWACAIVPY